MEHKIKLIGFDGDTYWDLFYLTIIIQTEINQIDLYYGSLQKIPIPSKPKVHHSLHGSGRENIKVGDAKKWIRQDIFHKWIEKPLCDLKEIRYLPMFCLINGAQKINKENYEIYDNKHKQHSLKKYNKLFEIDLRDFCGSVFLQPAIVPHKKATHDTIFKSEIGRKAKHKFIYNKSDPQIILYVLDIKDGPTSS